MATTERKKKLLKAKIAAALHDALGRVPKKEEIENVFLTRQGHVQRSVRPTLSEATAEERQPARNLTSSTTYLCATS
jgi:hypothetical protein